MGDDVAAAALALLLEHPDEVVRRAAREALTISTSMQVKGRSTTNPADEISNASSTEWEKLSEAEAACGDWDVVSNIEKDVVGGSEAIQETSASAELDCAELPLSSIQLDVRDDAAKRQGQS